MGLPNESGTQQVAINDDIFLEAPDQGSKPAFVGHNSRYRRTVFGNYEALRIEVIEQGQALLPELRGTHGLHDVLRKVKKWTAYMSTVCDAAVSLARPAGTDRCRDGRRP